MRVALMERPHRISLSTMHDELVSLLRESFVPMDQPLVDSFEFALEKFLFDTWSEEKDPIHLHAYLRALADEASRYASELSSGVLAMGLIALADSHLGPKSLAA